MNEAAVQNMLNESQRWRKVVNEGKLDKAKWEGKLAEIMNSMELQFGIKTSKAAKKAVEEWRKELDKFGESAENLRDMIKEKYNL